jgi:hypothetical protein
MSFTPNYNLGGVVDEVKKIHLPPGLFPDPDKLLHYTKGFRFVIPALTGIYTDTFTVPWDCHLVAASVVCSGYFDGDFWEMYVGDETDDANRWVETCYTKELPETVEFTNAFAKVPSGTVVTVNFHNDSGTSKTVWLNLKFLHG